MTLEDIKRGEELLAEYEAKQSAWIALQREKKPFYDAKYEAREALAHLEGHLGEYAPELLRLARERMEQNQ